jgi:hypothetical protein
MATVNATSQDAGVSNFASGSFTSDNTATVVKLGFNARWVKVINSTDVIVWEKIEGMAAANSVKTVTAGTTTVDTGSAILINTDGTITISQTAVGNSKAISWVAMG